MKQYATCLVCGRSVEIVGATGEPGRLVFHDDADIDHSWRSVCLASRKTLAEAKAAAERGAA